MSDKRTLQAAAVLLGVFVLGLVSGVGGTLLIESRLRPPPPERFARLKESRPETAFERETLRKRGHFGDEPSPHEEERGPGAALLERLDLSDEQREHVEDVLAAARAEVRARGGELGERLKERADRLLADLREAVPDERLLAPLEERIARLGERTRGRLPPPQKIEEGLERWVDSLPPEVRNDASAIVDRFMNDYWRLFREFSDTAGEIRRRARQQVGERLTEEQRERLRREIREER